MARRIDDYRVEVVRGDCLWTIADQFLGSGTRWTEIYDLNGLSSTVIYSGDILYINVPPVQPAPSNPPAPTQKVVTVEFLGLKAEQAGEDARNLYVTWSWSRSNTAGFRVKWWYQLPGVSVWKVGEEKEIREDQFSAGSLTIRFDEWSAPSDASGVSVQILPFSDYWSDVNWNVDSYYWFSSNPPSKPSAPSVYLDALDKFKLTAELENLPSSYDKINFQVIKNDLDIYKTGTVDVTTGTASYSCVLEAGNRYKVRCQAETAGQKGPWSDYTSNIFAPPVPPENITELQTISKNVQEGTAQILISWTSVTGATGYTIEWTDNISNFDTTQGVSSMDADTTSVTLGGMSIGHEYFFRVRSVNNSGYSTWTDVKSVVVGVAPSPPTTWSSASTISTSERLILYWVHNAKDDSPEKKAEVSVTINGVTIVYQIDKNQEELDKVSQYEVDISSYSSGAVILWKVRTRGVIDEYSDWSVERTVNVYAPAEVTVSVKDSDDVFAEPVDSIDSFPFYLVADPGPIPQHPIGYYFEICSKSRYESVDDVGNIKVVNADDPIFSRYVDSNDDPFTLTVSAENITLENGITYVVKCTVSMDSGLTAYNETEFRVDWVISNYSVGADITINYNDVSANIHPYCESFGYKYYKVVFDSTFGDGIYRMELDNQQKPIQIEPDISTSYCINTPNGVLYVYKQGQYIKTENLIYQTSDNPPVLFCQIVPDEGDLAEEVLLSVYRREYNGTFTEIIKDVQNTNNVVVTDPHPSLDYARYRIIAKDIDTGKISYNDIPGFAIQEKAVIIQWDEPQSYFDSSKDIPFEQQSYSGTVLRLPYNIDIQDNHEPDVELVNYIGRENPVSYYGTQKGIGATWNMDIDKKDVETLYALRRLAIWMGNVYVREPSGSGYWASIKVSFKQQHKAVHIPITLSITKVEGGV